MFVVKVLSADQSIVWAGSCDSAFLFLTFLLDCLQQLPEHILKFPITYTRGLSFLTYQKHTYSINSTKSNIGPFERCDLLAMWKK